MAASLLGAKALDETARNLKSKNRADEGECRSGAPAGVFDDPVPRIERPSFQAAPDNGNSHTVLVGPCWIEPFQLHPDFSCLRRHNLLQAHQWSVSNRSKDVGLVQHHPNSPPAKLGPCGAQPDLCASWCAGQGEFKDKTSAPNQLWQTDFTYLKVTGWGWFYLSTVLDDFSRYIVAWKLCATMKASDVTDTLTMALEASGLDSMNVLHRPRLLSDNGSSYIAGDLADWLEDKRMDHVRGAPLHPQTQGKIERWHQTLKNRILLENYYLPGDLEQKIGDFVAYYNHLRYHESIGNLTPADVYFGRGQTILLERERIKRDTIKTRRLQHRGKAA